ncbi:hypothetical protein [Streptomyces chryseus]
MALSQEASDYAAEIRLHDWSDAPYRTNRAGHDRTTDYKATKEHLNDLETARVRWNVMITAAQFFQYRDPNFNLPEFAEACGVDMNAPTGRWLGNLEAGLRHDRNGHVSPPGRPASA